MKSLLFCAVMSLCAVAHSQELAPDPFLVPVPDPISTIGAEELPTCEDLGDFATAYSIIIDILNDEIAKNEAAIDVVNMQIMQNDMNIYAAIIANASNATLISLRVNGESLIIVRNVHQATLTANQELLMRAYGHFMDLSLQLMLGACR